MKRRSLLLSAGSAWASPALVLASNSPGSAASWPSKPVKIVHGFSSGLIDDYARMIATFFHEFFQQPAYVEQRIGAGGTIAANHVSKSPPDGHTLYLMASGHAAAPALYASLPYDAGSDFTVVSMLTRNPVGFVAAAAGPYPSIRDLVEKAKASPGAIDLGIPGVGTGPHLGAVLFQAASGIKLTAVPYKGESVMLNALMGNEIPVIVSSVAGLGALLASGKLRLLAVTSRERSPLFPTVETIAETVAPGFDFVGWSALAGPKGLPAPITARLNAMMKALVQKPEIVATMRGRGTTLWATESAFAQSFVAGEIGRWSQAVRDAKIAPQQS